MWNCPSILIYLTNMLRNRYHKSIVLRILVGMWNCRSIPIYLTNMFKDSAIDTYIRAGSSLSPQIASATNAACNSSSNVTYTFSIILTAMNSGRGRHRQFFCSGPTVGLAPVAKTCPHRPRAFKKVNNGQAFLCVCVCVFFWTSRLQVFQGISVKSFKQKIEDLTA